MEKVEIRSWRELLKEACQTPEKKQTIAEAVGHVTTRTIDRWISGESSPHRPEMVLQAVSTDAMASALQEAFPESFRLPKPSVVRLPITLPSEFYLQIIQAYALVGQGRKRYTIFNLVSTQMIPHLDADLQGLVLVLVRASPDASHTLQFMESAGNKVWSTRQISQNPVEAADAFLLPYVVEGNPFFSSFVTNLRYLLFGTQNASRASGFSRFAVRDSPQGEFC